jgi:RimJ/RimL family protein N-acetyltransferase
MHWAVSIPDLEETRQHQIASAARAERGEDFPLLCFERASGEFVLATALHPVSIEVPSFQIGYWCRARFEGKGYVTEAVRAISEVALHSMGANRIEIRCDVVNHRSRAVAERCGFQLEGVLKNECRTPDGRLRSTALYVRVPDTYFAPEA